MAIWGELRAEERALEEAVDEPEPSRAESGSDEAWVPLALSAPNGLDELVPEVSGSGMPSCCASRSGKAEVAEVAEVAGVVRVGVLERAVVEADLEPASGFVIAVRRAAALSAGLGIGDIMARGGAVPYYADTLFLGRLTDGARARVLAHG